MARPVTSSAPGAATPKAVGGARYRISEGGGTRCAGTILCCLGAERFGLLDVERFDVR
ncbi:MAG: hypothetical protein JO361_11305 [Gammaproteobacteria bacterium]|nr:hypothetical protein [Gammaproteobacteria bacterium]